MSPVLKKYVIRMSEHENLRFSYANHTKLIKQLIMCYTRRSRYDRRKRKAISYLVHVLSNAVLPDKSGDRSIRHAVKML